MNNTPTHTPAANPNIDPNNRVTLNLANTNKPTIQYRVDKNKSCHWGHPSINCRPGYAAAMVERKSQTSQGTIAPVTIANIPDLATSASIGTTCLPESGQREAAVSTTPLFSKSCGTRRRSHNRDPVRKDGQSCSSCESMA
jgi:hypothetical protein